MKKFVNFLIVFGVLCAAAFLGACNVTRTMINESRYFQRGDTAVVIQTKTVETYDARKHLNYFSAGLPLDDEIRGAHSGAFGLPGETPRVGQPVEKTLLRTEQVATPRNLRGRY